MQNSKKDILIHFSMVLHPYAMAVFVVGAPMILKMYFLFCRRKAYRFGMTSGLVGYFVNFGCCMLLHNIYRLGEEQRHMTWRTQ